VIACGSTDSEAYGYPGGLRLSGKQQREVGLLTEVPDFSVFICIHLSFTGYTTKLQSTKLQGE